MTIMIAAVPVAAPASSSSDTVVVVIILALVLSLGGLLVWKWTSGKDDNRNAHRPVTAYDWMNTNAPTFYPTAIPAPAHTPTSWPA